MEYSTAWRCSIASTDPTLGGSTLKHEGRRQTDRRAAYAGSRLKLIDASGRSRLIRQPFSRNGENSPYGMLGGIEETAASFEARFAPRSYPTASPLTPPERCAWGRSDDNLAAISSTRSISDSDLVSQYIQDAGEAGILTRS